VTTVAFQGERGAYSESAVYDFFGSKAQVKPCKDFKEVFDNVCAKETDFGVVLSKTLWKANKQNYDFFQNGLKLWRSHRKMNIASSPIRESPWVT
jgi:hypothetical protein